MTMRIGIFYLSHYKTADDLQGVWLKDGTSLWIRVEEVEAEDVEAALDMAEPRDGEIVMNTHELDPDEERLTA